MPSNTPRYEILKDSYRELQSQMESQFLHSAIEQVLHFLKFNPGHAKAHSDLGLFYYRKGDKLQALGHYQKANRLAPDDLGFLKSLANFYLKEMEWVEEASALYREVLQALPDDVEALVALATISSGEGRGDEARAFLERILKLQPQEDPAAEPAPRKDRHEEPKPWSPPVVTLQACVPQTPCPATPPAGSGRKSSDELYLKSRNCAENGRTGDAIEALEGLVSENPEHALAHNDLGVLYQRGGDPARAMVHQKIASDLQPDNDIFAKNLVGLYLEQGMTDEAIHALLDQLRRHPEDVETITALGNISLSVDRPQEARTFFEKVLALEPWNQAAREAVASLAPSAPPPCQPAPPAPQADIIAAAPAAKKQEPASLDQLLARLRNSAPAPSNGAGESAETLYRQAQQALESGAPERAAEQLEALIASHPDFAPAYNDLGVLHFRQNDRKRALARHRQAVSLDPENLDFSKNLAGLCLTDPATLDEAILLLTGMIKSHPGDIETLFTLGRICSELERPEESRTFLRRLLDIEPWHREAQELLLQVEKQQ